MTRPDPGRRRDGLCAREGCGRPLVEITPRHRKYGGAALEVEPFCSVECCRAYHDQPELSKLGRDRYVPDIGVHHASGGVQHGTRWGYRLCACEACTAAVKGAA